MGSMATRASLHNGAVKTRQKVGHRQRRGPREKKNTAGKKIPKGKTGGEGLHVGQNTKDSFELICDTRPCRMQHGGHGTV